MEIIAIYNSFKEILMKWKIANNSQYNICGQDEDYLHYLISCSCLKEYWVKIQRILRTKTNIYNFAT
jgi:hypothetical protein